jgi:hypothetical protein
MAIRRAAGAAIGRPRFLGDGHLSSYFVYLSVQCQSVLRRRLSLTGICTSISSHLKIDRSGGEEGLVPPDAGEVHLSTVHLHPKGGMCSTNLALLFLFFLAGVLQRAGVCE